MENQYYVLRKRYFLNVMRKSVRITIIMADVKSQKKKWRIKMFGVLSIIWFIAGIFFAIAGKTLIEVVACLLLAAIFDGCYELHLLREELEDLND